MKKVIFAIIIFIALSSPALAQAPDDAANRHLTRWRGKFSAWQDASLGAGREIYDLRGTLANYVYPVTRNEVLVGYMVIGVDGTLAEFAATTHPLFTAPALTDCPQVVRAAPALYYCRREDGAVINPDSGIELNLGAPRPQTATSSDSEYSTQGEYGIMAFGDAVIPGVPDVNQFYIAGCPSGCAPASAANIIAYRYYSDTARFANLLDMTTPGEQQMRLQDALRGYMGTWCQDGNGWTIASAIAPGMENYTSDRGYIPETEYKLTEYVNFSDYRDEIDAQRPVLIAFQNDDYYRGVGHAVTGVGYDNNGYYIVHDNKWPSGQVYINAYSDYGFIEYIFYDVMGDTITHTSEVGCGLPVSTTVDPPLTAPGYYTVTFAMSDNEDCGGEPSDLHSRNVGIGLGCTNGMSLSHTSAPTLCLVSDIMAGVMSDAGEEGAIEILTSYFTGTFVVTNTAILTELTDLWLYPGTGVGDDDTLKAWDFQWDWSPLTSTMPVTLCRNEDPNLDSAARWDTVGDVTFSDGTATLENTLYDASATYTSCYILNSDLANPFAWQAVSDEFAGALEDWADYQARIMEYGAGTIALEMEEYAWQLVDLDSGTYTMTINARAAQVLTVPLRASVEDYIVDDASTFELDQTDRVYSWTFSIDSGDYIVKLGRKDFMPGRAIINEVCIQSPAQSYTETRSAQLAQAVMLPEYSLVTMDFRARASRANLPVIVYKDGAMVGKKAVSTAWEDNHIAFTNEYLGPRDVRITFQSDDAADWLEIEYICLSRDDDTCLPWFNGGIRNGDFSENTGSTPDYWAVHPSGGEVGNSAYWTSTEEVVFPIPLDPALQPQPAAIDQDVTALHAQRLRVTINARSPSSETVAVTQRWDYASNNSVNPFIRFPADDCLVESSERSICVFDVELPDAYSISDYSTWNLYIGHEGNVGDDRPPQVVIDDVCVQAVTTPDRPPTWTPLPPTLGPGTPSPTATPTDPSGGPGPGGEEPVTNTPYPTAPPTDTPGAGTPTAVVETPWPTTTPWPTDTPFPSHTPSPTEEGGGPHDPLTSTPSPTASGTFTPTMTATPANTPTAYPTAAPQPTVDDLVDAECCTYCIYYNRETETIEEAGSISCAGCDNCVLPDTPTAPEVTIRDFFSVDFWAGWFWWVVSWIGWVGNLIAWLVCKGYYKWICPLICLLQTWLKFFWYSLQTWLGLPYDIWNYLLDNVLPALREWLDAIEELLTAIGSFFEMLIEALWWLARKCCCTPVYALLGLLTYFVRQSDHCTIALQPTPGPGTPAWTPTPAPQTAPQFHYPTSAPGAGTPTPTMYWDAATPTLLPCATPINPADWGVPSDCAHPDGIGEALWCNFIGGLRASQDSPGTNLLTVWLPRASLWFAVGLWTIYRIRGWIDQN